MIEIKWLMMLMLCVAQTLQTLNQFEWTKVYGTAVDIPVLFLFISKVNKWSCDFKTDQNNQDHYFHHYRAALTHTHLKGLGQVDRQMSKKGVESAGRDRGDWRVKGEGIEEKERKIIRGVKGEKEHSRATSEHGRLKKRHLKLFKAWRKGWEDGRERKGK